MSVHLRLTSIETVLAAIDKAKRVALDAYVLGNRRMILALERAAERGAHVELRLCAKPHDEELLGDRNAGLARELRDHGVHVRNEPPFGPRSRHDKIAIVDGRAFFDDRNWRSDGDETILARSARGALRARTKAAVLADEARLIRDGAGHDVLVATEALGPGPVADAVLERAQRGDRVRLIYNALECPRHQRETLAALRAANVQIATSEANHKLACVGNRAWIGSANATRAAGGGREWGTVLSGTLAAQLEARAEGMWGAARPSLYRNPRA